MAGFGRVDEIGLRAGGGHGRGDLASNVTRLADACADDPSLCGEDGLDCLDEALIEALRQLAEGVGFELQDAAGGVDMGMLRHAAGLDQICLKVIWAARAAVVSASGG